MISVIRTLPWASTGASFCSRSLATLIFPYLAAKWRGVKPFLVVAVRDAPFSRRTEATWDSTEKRNK